MTKKKAIIGSIAHWERMIEWVEKALKRTNRFTDYPSIRLMTHQINESWIGDEGRRLND